MLELLVWKKYAECTSQRVKRTSGARDLTISFRQLSGPKTLKLPDLNIVVLTISFRNEPVRKFLKQPEGQKFLKQPGPAPDSFSAFPVMLLNLSLSLSTGSSLRTASQILTIQAFR